ncbi:MAG TPA: hypothetical protein VFQ12_02860 [Thermoleophilaceae bacterium]|nr:hypothetical protein [Thermoleophilaceae bacterium]
MAATLLVIAQFLDPGRGPEQRGDFRVSPTIFLALAIGGFVIGTLGHLIRSRTLQAIGVAMIFLATLVIPVAIGVTR